MNKHYTSKSEHPLALYIFSKDKKEQQKIMKAVPSGTAAINDVLKQAGNVHLVSTSHVFCVKFFLQFYTTFANQLPFSNWTKLEPSHLVALVLLELALITENTDSISLAIQEEHTFATILAHSDTIH